jgi:hypothetical protein
MEAKPWYLSKTIWGLILAATAPIVNKLLHVTLGTDGQDQLSGDIVNLCQYIQEAVGIVLGIFGRITVDRPIAGSRQAKFMSTWKG